jgi:hypothetical protein
VIDGTNADRRRCQRDYGEAPESDCCLHVRAENRDDLPATFPRGPAASIKRKVARSSARYLVGAVAPCEQGGIADI